MRILKNLIKKIYINKFKECGKNLRFNPFNCYLDYSHIKIGNNVFINSNAYIAGSVIIGDNVLIGPNVTIIDGTGYHNYDTVGKYINAQEKGTDSTINIGNDSWIAANVTILKGANIGEGSVIGAGSLVTRTMPPYCVCFGTPCKPIKFRYTDEELRKHFEILKRDPKEAEKIIQKRNTMFNDFSDLNFKNKQ